MAYAASDEMRHAANISLTEAHSAFVENLIVSGRYANVSEVARAGRRLLQRQEDYSPKELREMEKAWDEGVASGPAESMEPVKKRLTRIKKRLANRHK